MNITYEIINALGERYGYIDYCHEYGERGYSTDKKCILFSNWNNWPKHIQAALEKHFELEWADEWIIDHNRSKAYRTSPDCYSWMPQFIFMNGDIYTQDDVDDDPETYIEYLNHDPDVCSVFKIDYAALGFTIINTDYESGWYHHNDDPKTLMEELEKQYPNHDIIFTELRNEQFRSTWKVAVRPCSK